MAAPSSLPRRLLTVALPTRLQTLVALVTSLGLLLLAQSQAVIDRLNLPADTLAASHEQFQSLFDAVLHSPVVSQIALVTFWAAIGLGAYLLCWGMYSLLVEARNQVTLKTTYTNRGHWRGAYETLAVKAVAAVGLIVLVATLQVGISFWLALSAHTVEQPSPLSALYAVGAVIGFATELYLVFAFIQLTFTPWYRSEAFTEA